MPPEVLLNLAARRMPPPERVGLPLRLVPTALEHRVVSGLLNRVLAEQAAEGEFDFLQGRYLAVEVSDMQLRRVFTVNDGRLLAASRRQAADATIRGRAVEFLLLAARLEDPDTLFFQRRLEVTGDTALGLTVRNHLDRLPLEAIPLPARILLNRVARFGKRVRQVKG
ncbi:SCP2 sterol-binding domain-containing protein [Wenzhouxiangella sp. AB-CW3]|uniref:ubiquinone anaerobic biosynthesis accessory factor UbiT n=1 Tax=Wenzhouxiangella sp. AB-CW3 TaxID=2771012 RepID=UPI00168A94B3|nr:SCP2 sterol-binding domain-containing protein [Wenzhouxiangella sp. AB-CW3]QOC22493.1 SCP2 sterol-binding domain-containing protein [Wenzhouxiangella sp. AB-CW3]